MLRAPRFCVLAACLALSSSLLACTADVEPVADEPPAAASSTADELTAGELACTLSKVASGGALVGSVVCWVGAAYTAGGASPVCVWLSSAGVTAAKVANGAAQCATGCGLAGAVCHDLASTLHGGRIPSRARAVNGGCTRGGWYAAEADVCGMGLNRSYARDAPESRACVPGVPTGFWALSNAERAYVRDPAHCSARGFTPEP